MKTYIFHTSCWRHIQTKKKKDRESNLREFFRMLRNMLILASFMTTKLDYYQCKTLTKDKYGTLKWADYNQGTELNMYDSFPPVQNTVYQSKPGCSTNTSVSGNLTQLVFLLKVLSMKCPWTFFSLYLHASLFLLAQEKEAYPPTPQSSFKILIRMRTILDPVYSFHISTPYFAQL